MRNLKDKTRRSIMGYVFISPFILGFFLIFSYALITSVMFACSEISINEKGYELNFVGLDYFKNILTVHPTYNRSLFNSIRSTLLNVPLVVFFSFFMAVLLNQNFKGRSFVRVLFFTPVILSTGILQKMDNFKSLESGFAGGELNSAISETVGIFDLSSFLLSLDI